MTFARLTRADRERIERNLDEMYARCDKLQEALAKTHNEIWELEHRLASAELREQISDYRSGAL